MAKYQHIRGVLIPHSPEAASLLSTLCHQDTLDLYTLDDARERLGASKEGKITSPQNRAIHLWLEMIAKECRSQGITMEMILDKTLDTDVTQNMLKEGVWKKLCMAMFGSESSQKIDPSQVNEVYVVADRFFTNHFNITIPFPTEFGEFYESNER